MKSEVMRIGHELQAQKDKIKENTEKIKVNKTLPYLVSNVIEVGYLKLFEPRQEKTCLRGLRQGKTQNSLLSYTD